MNSTITDMIREAAAMGAAEAIRRLAPKGDRISQRKAEAEFGRAFLRDHASELTVVRNGNRKEYSRSEMEQLRASLSVAAMVIRIENNLFKQ